MPPPADRSASGPIVGIQAATTAVFDAVTREERELLDAVSLPPVLHP
ncbi:hypothetical protein GOB20_27940 [Sinorhizobium meliloti]|nr:hypothetical protein [Sinorhizobium meliloti]MDX0140741.1 hypothetical protein [Sinorhizobium meliloti]MDX0384078.1 hypothetical protein [Sinorhizobium meliloti]